MAELERQASISESPNLDDPSATELTHRSITSYALTSLLPIAAASGVVRANYDTPKISFYSPSGNLIQAEGSSSPQVSVSPPSLPMKGKLYNNELNGNLARKTLSATTCSPPARPTLVPLTTLPTITASLPLHLSHHHNHRHPERSQIELRESIIEPTLPVKGCGGVIQAHNFPPRSGVIKPPQKATTVRSRPRSTRSLVHDLKSDVSYYKSRYIALAAQFCVPTQKSKKTARHPNTLRKRYVTFQEPASALSPRQPTRAATTEKKGRRAPYREHQGVLGPRAGHALRICFCQPYDGAGKLTRTNATYSRQSASTMQGAHKKQSDLQIEDEGAVRPILRCNHSGISTHKEKARKNRMVRGEAIVV